MKSQEIIVQGLKKINRTSIDYLAVLNYLDTDILHADIDVLAILKTSGAEKEAHYEQLKRFMESFNRVTKGNEHAFSSLKHQMFFEDELRRNGISVIPVHLLVYPGSFYFQKWEIPSRIRSMLKTALPIYRSRNWRMTFVQFGLEPYQPFVFLQILYEAYVLWTGANMSSRAVDRDVLKKIEFSCKNLALESLLKCEGMTRRFNTSWAYLMDHLAELEQEGIPVQIVNRLWDLKRTWNEESSIDDYRSLFDDAFAFYDATVRSIFSE